jgi:C4-dicarboxylate transporter, DctM subunit
VTVGFCIIVALVSRPLYRLDQRLGQSESEDLTRTPGWIEMVLDRRASACATCPRVVLNSARIAGMLAPLIGISVVMQQILSILGAKDAIEGCHDRAWAAITPILLMAMAFVFIAGMVLESLPNTIIMAPILAPIAVSVGVDPCAFRGDLPDRGLHRLHHPALRAEPLCGERRYRCAVYAAAEIHRALL